MKREHSPENVRLGKVVFFICVVLSMIAVTFCKGQNTRMHKYPDNPGIVTIFPGTEEQFNYGKEKVRFSAFMDSLPNGSMFAYIYAYFPKSFVGYDNKITIGLARETAITLNVSYIDESNPEEIYVEYLIPGALFEWILKNKYNYIYVNNVKQFIVLPPKGSFFTDFFMSMAFGK